MAAVIDRPVETAIDGSMYLTLSILDTGPYARAQSLLYYMKKANAPTLSGAEKPFDSMSQFLGITVGPQTNYIDTMKRKTEALFSGWRNPWLPGQKENGSIWNRWYTADRDLYMKIVPAVSTEAAFLLWDIPGSTAWSRAVERERAPKTLHNSGSYVNRRFGFPQSVQQEYKDRGLGSDSSYSVDGLGLRSNTIPYMEIFGKVPSNTDYGDIGLDGDEKTSYTLYHKARYFPFMVEAMPKLEQRFPLMGKMVTMPSYTATGHYALWNVFPRPTQQQMGTAYTVPVWNY